MTTWGGRRAGAGRPSLYPGKTEQISVTLTPLAKEAATETAAELQAVTIPPKRITFSDAVEYLIRKATGR